MIPNEIVAGDSVSWFDEAFKDNIGNDIDPSAWTLKYAIRGAVTVTKTASVVDGKWKTTLAPADTSEIASSTILYWQAYAEKDTDRVTLATGQITVKPSLVSVEDPEFDGRSQIKKDLDAVQAAIRAMISGGAVKSYTIGTRQIEKMSLSDLFALESRLKADYAQETKADKIAKGLGNPRNLYIRFK